MLIPCCCNFYAFSIPIYVEVQTFDPMPNMDTCPSGLDQKNPNMKN